MLAYRRASITRHAAGMQQHLLLCILVAGAASWLTPGFFFCQLQLVLLLLLLARGLGAWPACTLQLAAAAAAATGQPASPAGCEWTSAGAPAPRPSRWRCACSIAWQAQAGRVRARARDALHGAHAHALEGGWAAPPLGSKTRKCTQSAALTATAGKVLRSSACPPAHGGLT